MKKILALLLAVLTCLPLAACSGGAITSVVGTWYDCRSDDYVAFLKNGTGEVNYDGVNMVFDWTYSDESQAYQLVVGGKKFSVQLGTEEGLTYLAAFGNFFFRKQDRKTAKALAPAIRNNYIDTAVNKLTLLPVEQTIRMSGGVSICISSIFLSDDKCDLLATLSVTCESDTAKEALNSLIKAEKLIFYDATDPFSRWSTGYSSSKLQITQTALTAGESLNATVTLMSCKDLPEILKSWGVAHAYFLLTVGTAEYCIDLRDYTKQ